MKIHGLLSLEDLRQKTEAGEIETVIVAFTDHYGRLMGKRYDAFLFAYAAIALAPASWWVGAARDSGVPDLQAAYAYVFGQGLWTIAGSITAFLVGQLIDVRIFHSIRKRTVRT